MHRIRAIFSFCILIGGAGLGIWFYLDNLSPVTVVFFGHSVEGFQLALWLLIFFVAGTFLGLTVSGIQSLRHQMQLQVLRKQLKALKQKANIKVPS